MACLLRQWLLLHLIKQDVFGLQPKFNTAYQKVSTSFYLSIEVIICQTTTLDLI